MRNKKIIIIKAVHTHKDQDKILCDSGIRITWVHVSRVPIATPGQ